MDRFIAASEPVSLPALPYLKSNMDRFIVKFEYSCQFRHRHLKSNMDRFIDSNISRAPLADYI